MSARLELKIFLSSPGDVSDERGLARRVLDRLSQEHGLRDRIHLEEVSWDDPGAPVPMDAHLTPQEAINNRRPKPSQCDVVVVILWSRMGTPLPPEHRKPDGTPYVSGTEWEFCDAMDGAKRIGKPTVLVYRHTEEPRIGLGARDLDEKHRQYKGVETFFAQFTNTDGSLRQSYTPYVSPSEFADKLERALRELIRVQLDALPKDAPAKNEGSSAAVTRDSTPAWEGNPYLGLNAFRERHAAIFFGRGRETDELIKRFATPTKRIVAVIGASGSGKSSLVGAGLIPRLHNGALAGSADWVSVRFTPAERGSDPFVNLTRKLAAKLPDASESPEALADHRLRTKPTELKELAERALQGKPRHAELLLFADQFEELFSARVDERHRDPFIGLIDAIAASPRIRLVLTLRADYYEHCTRDPRLAALLRDGSFPLSAPNARALTEMIERPARVAGLEPGPGLVDAILEDVGTEPGTLALVEFALEELYERSGGKQLTVAAYHSLGGKDGGEVGGIGGVIEGQAEKAVQDAAGKVDEAALGKIFRQLADVDEKGGAVRKRARLDAFADREQALLNRLVDGRLLVTNKDDANVSWVEVAHEAVLRHWSRLAKWLTENRAFLLWRKRLKVFSDSRSVLHGKALSEALAWFKRYAPELDASERDFIKRSRRSRWRRRLFVGTMMPFGTVLLGLAIYAGYLGWIWACTEFNLWRIHNGTMALPPEPAMVTVPAGEFQMGSSPTNDPDADPAEMPQHLVKFSKPFLIGAYEVTFEEYDAFIQMTGRLFQKPDDFGWGRGKWPVIGVSWTDARAYAEFLSYATGKHYRLPTEAEWEYAARAGTDTPFWWGKDAGRDNANCSLCGNTEGVGQKTLPVGTFKPNPLGLYDTAGNVGEWVQDCWHENYNGAPSDESAWRATNCYQGVIRGGSWLIGSRFARSATRGGFTPDWRFNSVGFRLAQDLD